MNDTYYEQLVTCKPTGKTALLSVLSFLPILILILFGFPFLGFFAFMLAALYAVLAYYFIFPRFNVEYEYDLLNHELDIAAIYSKANRKDKLSIDIQHAEIIAPKNSHRLDSYHTTKRYDFSSGNANANTYAIIITLNQTLCTVLFDPDDEMLRHMKGWMGMKLYQD